MQEDQNNDQQYDSEGGEFEKPKDEFMFYYKAFKIEEKKFVQHQRFEEIAGKYWQLLRRDSDCDCSQPFVSQILYTKLMKRMYKVLLPLYREEEVSAEVAQEWIMDCKGLEGLNFSLFTKLLFRVAHQWAVNIDLDEYIDLLNRIYSRIVLNYYTLYWGAQVNSVTINLTFPNDEKKITEAGGSIEKGARFDDWLECRSDESNKSDYEYKYEEDQVNMMVKKYKKMKNDFGNLGPNNSVGVTIKEPFVYNEEVVTNYATTSSTYDILNPTMEMIYPFGYFAEQFFMMTKNDIYASITSAKENNKLEIIRLKREMREQNKDIDLSKYAVEEDAGLLPDPSATKQPFAISVSGTYYGATGYANMSPLLYNNIRRMMREATCISIRPLSEFPKPGAKTRQRSQLVSGDPLTEINKFGYNPAIERRISFKLMPIKEDPTVSKYFNIHYLVRDPYLETVYRCDVQKVETKGKMAIKESDDIKKEEEFVNVETNYKKVRQIMLSKKFGSIFQDRTASDNKEQKRLKKIVEKEERRRAAVVKPGSITQKGMGETYEEKSFIKMMRGPYYQMESKAGAIAYDSSANDLTNAQAMRILVIGKPRSGKTKLAKNISLKLDLVHINVDNWIAAVFEKIKAYEPPELEEGQEAPKFLSDLEEEVNAYLKSGKGPTDDHIVEIIRQQIASPQAKTKGYILDLPFYPRACSWTSTIRQTQLLGLADGYNQQEIQFTHVIELLIEDEEIRLRAQNMRVDPVDGVVYSRWEREERKKPKPVPEDEDAQEEDEENAIKPLDEGTLVQRINDTDDKIKEELNYYNTMERPAMEEIFLSLFDNQYIKIDCVGLTPDELQECVTCKITPDKDLPLRPKGIQIENGSDFKSLLTEGQEENQIPRQWGPWKLMDPVALLEGKLIQGTSEFAASYNNVVFVFSSEENMKSFLLEPKKYIIIGTPSIPTIYRILLLGPKGVGKHTQALNIANQYSLKVVDFKEIVRAKIEEMCKLEIHIPNNPLPGGRIGLSEQELYEIVEGKAFPAWKFIPWIFDYLGYELEKKRPPPPEEKGDEELPDEEVIEEDVKKKKDQDAKKKKEEDEKKRKEEEEIQRQKEDRRKRRQEAIDQGLDLIELGLENEDEEIVIIEDLSIDQLALKINEQTGKAPSVTGFILIGFPENEDQLNKLKESGIDFDKVIYFGDTNEEEPGAEIKKRMIAEELYDYDFENEFAQKILGVVKEQLGDDIVKEISCNGSEIDVMVRIKNEIDPFFMKIDNPDDVRTSADLGEDDKKLPKGDFGDYCPVTYVNDYWLVRGNPEFEVVVNGKTYWLSGEKEAELFKFNPGTFINAVAFPPLIPPAPKILILGQKGAGVSTQIRMLCEKFKLEEFNLKDELLKKLKEQKEQRKRRRLLDRGFKPLQPPDEEGMESPPDPEIEDDPEDFDRAQNERDVLKLILNFEDKQKGLVIDGTWTDLPEDAVSQSLQDLLFESRRVPEIVIMFKCKEKSTFDRMIDYASIKADFENQMEKRALDRQKAKDEDRLKKVEELAQDPDEDKTQEDKDEELKKWDEDREAEDEAADEGDPEKPNLDEMTEKFRENLRERREKDEAFIEEFGTVLKEKSVFVIDDIKTDISAEYVFIKIQDRIKDNFQFRNDLVEKQLAQILKPEEVKFYEQSYTYMHSRFGLNSPMQQNNPIKSKKFAVLYRERIFFLSNEVQQQQFLKEPSKYSAYDVYAIPKDIAILPKIVVLGYSKIGKSTLCKKLVEKIGVVHLHMPKIIEQFLNQDSLQCDGLRKILQKEGKQLEDEFLVSLLLKRLQFSDCQTKGFVLEDFPKTRYQAMLLAKRGFVPSNLFYLRNQTVDSVYRNQAREPTKFGAKDQVFNSRQIYTNLNLPNLLSFYQRFYNNISEIDVTKSKWYVEDRAMKEIALNLGARQEFTRTYCLRDTLQTPCKVMNLHMDRCLVKQSLSEFKYYCPVTWKNEKTLSNCVENFENCLLYLNAFYYFKGIKERDLFIINPTRFITNINLPKLATDLPLRLQPHKAAEIVSYEKALNGHCATTLMDEERVAKGDPILLINYKDAKYAFESEYKLQRFLANPFKYSKAVLPVKMPANEDKLSLYNLSKMEDSISFMEQALGQIVTRALREVSENRLKYPGISVKETMLKLFSLFLKTNNPANTDHMKRKYLGKMKQFIQRCELPEEIFDLAKEKEKKKVVEGGWVEHKETNYNKLGDDYDKVITIVAQEKIENFINYIR